VVDSADGITEQMFRITTLRANGADTVISVKLLDSLRSAHRLLLEQLAIEEAKALG
jgi:hypothetical protein